MRRCFRSAAAAAPTANPATTTTPWRKLRNEILICCVLVMDLCLLLTSSRIPRADTSQSASVSKRERGRGGEGREEVEDWDGEVGSGGKERRQDISHPLTLPVVLSGQTNCLVLRGSKNKTTSAERGRSRVPTLAPRPLCGGC